MDDDDGGARDQREDPDGGEEGRTSGASGGGSSSESGSPRHSGAGESHQSHGAAAGPSGRPARGGRSRRRAAADAADGGGSSKRRDAGGGGGGAEGEGDPGGGPPDEAKVRRRREINRNSQKRIRERKNKELEELRVEVRFDLVGWRRLFGGCLVAGDGRSIVAVGGGGWRVVAAACMHFRPPTKSDVPPIPPTHKQTQAQRLSSENEGLLQQVEALTRARAEMLLQLQDLTDKWQQSIAENV
jgi:hypothetical protein